MRCWGPGHGPPLRGVGSLGFLMAAGNRVGQDSVTTGSDFCLGSDFLLALCCSRALSFGRAAQSMTTWLLAFVCAAHLPGGLWGLWTVGEGGRVPVWEILPFFGSHCWGILFSWDPMLEEK